MFTIEDLLAYKAKAEKELQMAQAKIAVTEELIEMATVNEPVVVEDEENEAVAETMLDGDL